MLSLCRQSISISDVLVDRAPLREGTIYHTEDRPFEAGRTAPVLTRDGTDVLPEGWSARSTSVTVPFVSTQSDLALWFEASTNMVARARLYTMASSTLPTRRPKDCIARLVHRKCRSLSPQVRISPVLSRAPASTPPRQQQSSIWCIFHTSNAAPPSSLYS